ncbi:hypothetical protein LQ567_20195 [Niabella pedocola]|uniref:Uncharacterized protein n=1 Tax=Niabella pedocola TaxID=1752077 RepID=A0ABS8PVM4_9BACT|nr:hypothetical protein [Niabella pedocola]MCD2425118.1 hypothetical protein [Niabella pedocola]
MKKLCGFVLALMMYSGLNAQDPAVNGATVTPSPGLVNGQGKFSFNFQNLSNSPIPMGVVPTSVTISLNKFTPIVDGNGIPQVTGAGAAFFDWTYNAGTATVKGIQKQDIPGATDPMTPVGGPVVVEGVFSAASTPAQAGASNGNGANVNIQQGAGGNIKLDNDNTVAYTFTDGALPVAFGFTSASFSNGKLSVHWSTFTENANKSFSIELSKDGKAFRTADVVPTKATGGNSTAEIEYEYSKEWKEVSTALGFSFWQMGVLLLLAISVVLSVRQSKPKMMLFSLVLLMTAGSIGCRKNKRDVDASGEYPTVYLRIGQVNIDGTTTNYSKVIKVVAE